MSCVVGLVKGKKVWMGCDSFATTNTGERRPICTEKILKNGKYLIGFIGSVRGGQLLDPHFFKPPKNILDFPKKIMNIYHEHGSLFITENQISNQECNTLIAYKGGYLYEMMTDFQIDRVDGYTSVGSGSLFAFGSLHSTQDTDLTPEQRIIKALEAAACFDTATGPPFKVYSI